MLVAVETFVDPSDGRTIHEGRTRVDEFSDVALTYPERFRPSASRFSQPGVTAAVDATSNTGVTGNRARSTPSIPRFLS
jgi:hypothetical protein